MKYIVNGDQWVRVRAKPSITAPIIGAVKTGDLVESDTKIEGWNLVALNVGGTTLRTDSQALVPMYGYMLSTLLTPYNPLPTVQKPNVGLHLLFNPADKAIAADCKAFTIMNNTDLAAQLANCDPVGWKPEYGNLVFYRQYHTANPWTPADMVSQLGGIMGKGNHNVVLTLANEWDAGYSCKNAAEATSFCKWTVECVERLNAQGWYNIAVMTASMGTPEFTDQGVCDAIKTYLAPFWNSGRIRFLDMHNYSPNMQHIYNDPDLIWYERRWEFLYTKCGFDPKAQGKIVATETGVDEGSVGGFPAHNATSQQVVDWTRRYIEIQRRPIVVGGVSYPSPFLAGTIFQQGDSSTDKGHWGGYDVTQYLPALHEQLWHNG